MTDQTPITLSQYIADNLPPVTPNLVDPGLLFLAVQGTGDPMFDAQVIAANQAAGYTGPTHA